MVRHWFSLTIVMALAVLAVAVDDSQGRERRLGRRRRDNTVTYVRNGPALSGPYYMDLSGRLVDSMGNPVPGYVDEGLLASTQTGARGANYPPDMASSLSCCNSAQEQRRSRYQTRYSSTSATCRPSAWRAAPSTVSCSASRSAADNW